MNTKYKSTKKYKIGRIVFLMAMTIFIFSAGRNVQAAYQSQCNINSQGEQINCIHDNDAMILSNQCAPVYGSETCSSMSGYLSALQADCAFVGNSGTDCGVITSGGFYGREANSFATYLESNPSAANASRGPGTAGTGAPAPTSTVGNLEYPTGFGLPDPAGGLKGVMTSILNWLLIVVGIIAMISFAISGLQYFMAAGDQSQIDIAKRNMTYSMLGIIAVLSGFIIIRAVDTALRANVLF